MNTIEINGKELHTTDTATSNSNVYRFSTRTSNNSGEVLIIADTENEVIEYLKANLSTCEDRRNAEGTLLSNIVELKSFVDAYNDKEIIDAGMQHKTDIVNYMIDHSGDSVSIEAYVELVELVENATTDLYIEHSDLVREFRLIDHGDIEEIYQDSIEDLVKDCYLADKEIPSFIEIDWKATAENCMVDGYGHHFSSYDFSEKLINNTYIFCVN